MEYLLSTDSLTKRYGRHKAVNSVNIHIRQGDIYGLIGRNGAGKTTLLRMISGLASPMEGEFTLFGKRGKSAYRYLSRVGTLIEAPGIYPNMSAADNLRLKCLAMGVRKKGEIEELLDIVGLSETGKKKVKNFSMGMKQRLGIAAALVGRPDFLILDEPTNGLDPFGIQELRNLIKSFPEHGITVLVSSHILSEVEQMADHIGILTDGILGYQGGMPEKGHLEELFSKVAEKNRKGGVKA